MDIEQILAALTPEIVNRFRTAIEISKWPNGQKLTPEQRETCMQAVLAWEHKHLTESERTGYIDRGTKKKDESCNTPETVLDNASQDNPHEERPLRLV